MVCWHVVCVSTYGIMSGEVTLERCVLGSSDYSSDVALMGYCAPAEEEYIGVIHREAYSVLSGMEHASSRCDAIETYVVC